MGVQLSWLERLPVTQEVASSSLVTPAIIYAALAHLVEQLTCNQQVIGSTPISGTSKSNICGDGGIGRRARLRIQCPRRESSSLSLRTTLKKILREQLSWQSITLPRLGSRVRASFPAPKITYGGIAQFGRATHLHCVGQRFDPAYLHHYAQVAQLARAYGSYPYGRWFESIPRHHY